MPARTRCEKCNFSDCVQQFSDGRYCYACNTQLEGKVLIQEQIKQLVLPEQDDTSTYSMRVYLRNLGFKTNKNNDGDFRYCFWSKQYNRVVFPIYEIGTEGEHDTFIIVAAWMRSITSEHKPKWLFAGDRSKVFYYRNNVNYITKKLVITEDVISAIRVSSLCDSIALGGINSNNDSLTSYFKHYEQLLVWLDGDKAGRNGAEDFRKQYKLKNNIKIIRTKRDPKEYSYEEIEEILT